MSASKAIPFGEVARGVIHVKPRAEGPLPAPPPQDPNEKHVLGFDDFEYTGSFRVPCNVWSVSGLAFRKMPDGTRRLFVNDNFQGQGIVELEIPSLVKFDNRNIASLQKAEVKKVWGKLALKIPKTLDLEELSPNGGFWWDERKQTLYWTCYHGYWTGPDFPLLAASQLNGDGKATNHGPWRLPKSISPWKSYWGGVTKLSDAFARKYTGGRTLALGFGGAYSICAPCSRGPSLGAIREPDPARDILDMVELLRYSGTAIAPRDGDYFFGGDAGCYWYQVPDDPARGYWTLDDWCRSGVFIDLPDKHGYIAFARLGAGRLGYDYGAVTHADVAQYWYCYNPKDLGEAATGARKPEVPPHSRKKVTYPGINGGCNSDICGACFDEEKKQLFLYKPFAAGLGGSDISLIHVYQVK
jgi:hypothetical protein